jgi:bacterioferritin
MKGKQEVIDVLSEGLAAELTAINQFFIHSKMNDDWGHKILAKKYYEESIEEMKHAEDIIARILFLEGVPNMQKYNKIMVGQDIRQMYEYDLELEMDAVEIYNRGIRISTANDDNASRALFEKLLVDEEGHVDWLETQLGLLDRIGVENYLAHHMQPGAD